MAKRTLWMSFDAELAEILKVHFPDVRSARARVHLAVREFLRSRPQRRDPEQEFEQNKDEDK